MNDVELRDYFAAASLDSLSGIIIGESARKGVSSDLVPEYLASMAYKIADAMLEARDRNKKEVSDQEIELKKYKEWSHKFRNLLAPLAWLDGFDNPNETEKAIIQFDEENKK